ncbi:ferric reductase-like transmembrane domain-containing protein [Paracoccus ravus]|uniref:ferric reductase-like transmembrane domain-containing protein n=1 Tax=Paracoccus ravus TaxID=2447760 RepID=UPI001FD713A0|nr:ferric reductase-like transmembrane domain-containing protein [Paracoccus ravus]
MPLAKGRNPLYAASIWFALSAIAIGPILIAATSPYLAYRGIAYILGGFAGIFCLSLMLFQALLAAGYLPAIGIAAARLWHRRAGSAIVILALLHVGGLYLTSPEDTLDALLLASPTPFSVYGVVALLGIVATALLVLLRRRLGIRYAAWRLIHNAMAFAVVLATIIHALQIEGAMGSFSKVLLCVAVLAATGGVLFDLRVLKPLFFRRRGGQTPCGGRDARR